MAEEDEEALWQKFDPMREHFENPVENSYMIGSVGSTLPKRLMSYSKQNLQQATEVKLFVAKIPTHVTECGLRNIFSRYGKVLYVQIIKGKKDKHPSSHFGYVSFSSLFEANSAIQSINNVPPFFLRVEFECPQEEKDAKNFIENVALNIDRISSLDLNQSEEGDYSIKEEISYSPGLPLDNIDLSCLPSSVDTLAPYHMYKGRAQSEEIYEPYLVWEESSDSEVISEDVSHRIALKHYIPTMDAGDIIQDLSSEFSLSTVSNKKTSGTRDQSIKKIGVQGSRPTHSCAYCHRRGFTSSPHLCQCGVMYDDILCQHKHWPQHKLVCSPKSIHNELAKRNVDENVPRNKNEEDDFDKVVQGFKDVYSIGGTVLDDKLLNNNGVNIIYGLWSDFNSGLVTVINEILYEDLYNMDRNIANLPDATDQDVRIGQLVGVFQEEFEIYVRGIVACKTRRGLIGVQVLDHFSFVLSPSVKLIPPLDKYRQGVRNVQGTIVSRDLNFDMKKRELLYTRLKNSNQFRAFDSDYSSCTIELSPYLPSPEIVPLPCVNIEKNTKVRLTACHSAQALYIQPLDAETQTRCTVLASQIHNWCTKNHQESNLNWAPKKNQVVGVRQLTGEYRRGQVIGTVVPKKSVKVTLKSDSIDESISAKILSEKKYYLVSLIDSGINVKASSEDLLELPHHLKRDPCYCTKISLKNSNVRLNPECFLYLNLLVHNKTPLFVDYIEFITADLRDEKGNSVSRQVELLTALPWHTSQDGVLPDPTKTEAVLSLAQLKIPVYPVSRGHRIPLRMLNYFDQTFASMLVLSKEDHQYVQAELTPCMEEYVAQLTMDKYNPPSGGYCLAYCRDLKIWTRAHCEKSSDVHGHCFLFLVDYGVHAHLPISDIRPCHAVFTQYHSLAFIAHIPDFETTELSYEETMRKYSTHEYTVIQVVNCDEQHTVDRVVLSLE